MLNHLVSPLWEWKRTVRAEGIWTRRAEIIGGSYAGLLRYRYYWISKGSQVPTQLFGNWLRIGNGIIPVGVRMCIHKESRAPGRPT